MGGRVFGFVGITTTEGSDLLCTGMSTRENIFPREWGNGTGN